MEWQKNANFRFGEPPDIRAEFIDPVVEYPHRIGVCAVGGEFYYGDKFPELRGEYIYGDYQYGKIWSMRWDGAKVVNNQQIGKISANLTSFGKDEAGELYVTAFDGNIYRFEKAPATVPAKPFPKRLSETGFFTTMKELTPAPGLIPYTVNVPLWSDHASKERYLALPAKRKVVFNEDKGWEFPEGTVFIKTFFLEIERGKPQASKRLETRLLVRNPRRWVGYTYRWNPEKTEAYLLQDAETEVLDVMTGKSKVRQTWYYPSSSDCFSCHTQKSGFVLGVKTLQMNRMISYQGREINQLELLAELDIFTNKLTRQPAELNRFPDWDDEKSGINKLVNAYIDVNCAHCHSPPGYMDMDLRYHMASDQVRLLNREPSHVRLGSKDSKIVYPGKPDKSELYLRMFSRNNGQMPPLASSVVDEKAETIIRRWIESQ